MSSSPVTAAGLSPLSTLCITPNVALDRTLVVPRFTLGGACRADHVYTTIGGRGLNVARTLASLAKANHSAGFIGGASGNMAAHSAAAEGLTATWSRIGGETRASLIILTGPTEAGPAQATIITEPGPVVTDREWAQFEADVTQLAHGRSAVCICGSMPPGSPPSARQRLQAVVAGHGRPVWVDSGGEGLVQANIAPTLGLKLNAEEAAAATARPVQTVTDALSAAQWLAARGIARVAITLGSQGAVLVVGHKGWYARPPAIVTRNPVGSGDCFLAGLVAALGEGSRSDDALRLATACGTANALATRVGRLVASDVTRLAAEVAVHQIGLL